MYRKYCASSATAWPPHRRQNRPHEWYAIHNDRSSRRRSSRSRLESNLRSIDDHPRPKKSPCVPFNGRARALKARPDNGPSASRNAGEHASSRGRVPQQQSPPWHSDRTSLERVPATKNPDKLVPLNGRGQLTKLVRKTPVRLGLSRVDEDQVIAENIQFSISRNELRGRERGSTMAEFQKKFPEGHLDLGSR